jgi:hypothetical protein
MSVDTMSKDDVLGKFKFYVDLASKVKDPQQYSRTIALNQLFTAYSGRYCCHPVRADRVEKETIKRESE